MGVHIVWVSILLTALTLGSYLWGYAAHGMNPLSPTLGVEYLSRAQVIQLIDSHAEEALVPADWDSTSVEQRRVGLLAHENDEAGEEVGSGGILGEAEQRPRTISFTVLALGQIFHVLAIHAGDKASFFKDWFRKNRILLYAVLSTFLLHLSVIYVPFLQHTFETDALTLGEFAVTLGVAAVIFIAVEIEKALRRKRIVQAAA
jgi:magnesium-transporting ATPase (P-type)